MSLDRGQLTLALPARIYHALTGGDSAALARIHSWVSASRVRATTVRYVGTVVVMIAAIALASVSPNPESRWIAVIIAVLGCSWFGGIGPSLVAPLLLIFSIRIAQRPL